jgi:hypothetical protein
MFECIGGILQRQSVVAGDHVPGEIHARRRAATVSVMNLLIPRAVAARAKTRKPPRRAAF